MGKLFLVQANIAGIGVQKGFFPQLHTPEKQHVAFSPFFSYNRVPVKGRAMLHVDGNISEFLKVGTSIAHR